MKSNKAAYINRNKLLKYRDSNFDIIRVSTSELQSNLKDVTRWLIDGGYVEITKYGRKIGMIVPE